MVIKPLAESWLVASFQASKLHSQHPILVVLGTMQRNTSKLAVSSVLLKTVDKKLSRRVIKSTPLPSSETLLVTHLRILQAHRSTSSSSFLLSPHSSSVALLPLKEVCLPEQKDLTNLSLKSFTLTLYHLYNSSKFVSRGFGVLGLWLDCSRQRAFPL